MMTAAVRGLQVLHHNVSLRAFRQSPSRLSPPRSVMHGTRDQELSELDIPKRQSKERKELAQDFTSKP